MRLGRERADVAGACQRLAGERLVIGTGGNVSVRAGEEVVVTPTGGVLGELEAEAMSVVDRDGNVVDGGNAPTSELALHLGLYERFDAARAVVHTHAPMATALSCVVDEVPAIHYQMLAFGGTVRVAPYATFGTPELAERVLDTLDGRTAALMQNHGAITWGTDIASALDNALLLEWACTLYWHARMLGEPSTLSQEQLEDVVRVAIELDYGHQRPHGGQTDE